MSKILGKDRAQIRGGGPGMQKIHIEGIARKMSKCLDPSPQQH